MVCKYGSKCHIPHSPPPPPPSEQGGLSMVGCLLTHSKTILEIGKHNSEKTGTQEGC